MMKDGPPNEADSKTVSKLDGRHPQAMSASKIQSAHPQQRRMIKVMQSVGSTRAKDSISPQTPFGLEKNGNYRKQKSSVGLTSSSAIKRAQTNTKAGAFRSSTKAALVNDRELRLSKGQRSAQVSQLSSKKIQL